MCASLGYISAQGAQTQERSGADVSKLSRSCARAWATQRTVEASPLFPAADYSASPLLPFKSLSYKQTPSFGSSSGSEQVFFSTLLVDFKPPPDRFGRKTALAIFLCFTLGKETQLSCAWPFLLWVRRCTQELLLQHSWKDLTAVGRWVMPEGSDASQTLLHTEKTGWLLLWVLC